MVADSTTLMAENLGGLDIYQTIAEYLGISVTALLAFILILFVFKLIMYGIALYKTIERKQKIWFVVFFAGVFLINDLGILPIIYLLIYRQKHPQKKKK